MRRVLPEIERRMLAGYPDELLEWRAAVEVSRAAEEKWKKEVRDAHDASRPPPAPPQTLGEQEPQAPRLRQHDVTVEKVANLLANAAPKGLLICRDELVGWIDSMKAYNIAGRTFGSKPTRAVLFGSSGKSTQSPSTFPGMS